MAYSSRVKRLAILAALLGSAAAARPAGAWNFDWEGAVVVDAEDLHHELPRKRLDAVTALLGHDISLTRPYLLDALEDPDPSVRQAAAKGLGTGGVTEIDKRMIEWLGDLDPKTRVVAADVLGDLNSKDGADALTRSLGDPDPSVRQHAVRALAAIGRRGNRAVVLAIIPRLEDDKAEVKREAIEQLEALGDKRAVIPLVARFAESSPPLITAAVRAIGRLGDRSAVPALVRLLGDTRDEVRTAAVGALGVLGAVDALDALTEQLGVGTQGYRDKVAYALGQIAASPGAGKRGEDAMRTLVQSLADPTKRRGAREALAIAGKAVVPALVQHLDGRLAGDPSTAVELLGAAADPRATAALTSELERGRVAMPVVLKALGATGDPAALVPILGAVANKDPAIRIAAMEALRPILGHDARAADVLVEHLEDADLEIRVLAAEYLGLLAAPVAVPRLVALIAPGNPTRLREAAIDALGEIAAATHQPAASAQLVGVLEGSTPELHRAAAIALAYAADAATIAPLVALATDPKRRALPARHLVVRALGAILRAHPEPAGRRALRTLVADNDPRVAAAAIAGLAAGHDHVAAEDLATLRPLIEAASADRQRAAVWALGELHDLGAVDAIAAALAPRQDRALTDRLAGDAAWALGEIATSRIAAGQDLPQLTGLVDRWLYAEKFGGWATAIDGAGALARVLTALPAARRAPLLGARRADVLAMQFHKSRLVRINAAIAIGALDGDDATRALIALAQTDASVHVRLAAIAQLARRASADAAAKTLAAIATGDADERVRALAKAGAPAAATPRDDWRNFYVVDPAADDAPVRQEPYFVHGSDGVVWATYTDARGELASEHLPRDLDASALHAGTRELEY